jgi:hypothetical protein
MFRRMADVCRSPLLRFIAPVHITLSLLLWSAKEAQFCGVKRSWEIIADNLSKAGWSWGCVSAIDSNSCLQDAVSPAGIEKVQAIRSAPDVTF